MSTTFPTHSEHELANFAETLTTICEAAVKLVGIDHSGLVLFGNNQGYGTVSAEFPPSPKSTLGRRVQIAGNPFVEKLISERQPIVVNNVRDEESLGLVREVLSELGIVSMIIVPIVVDDEVKGSFSFDSIRAPREFRESDVYRCSNFAKFASIAIKNAYLVKNLGALRRAMLAVSSEQERVPLLRAITEEAVNLLQANGGGIDELDDRKGELTIVAQTNISDEIVGRTMKVGEGLGGSVIQKNLNYLMAPNYSEWADRAPYFRDVTTLGSIIGVPLRLHGRPTGVLWLNGEKYREFSPAEIELLQGFAAPASIALEQSDLREKEREKATRLAALARATNEIFVTLATKSRKERLTLIAKFAREVTDAETCAIFLASEPDWLILEAGDGHIAGTFEEGKKLRIVSGRGTGLTGHIAYEGRVFRMSRDELTNHFAVKHMSREADYSPSRECFSLLAIPLKTQNGELRGLICLGNKNDKDRKPNQWACFTDDDEAIGEIFAQAALVAIETAELLDEIKRGQDRYKTVLEASNVLALAKVPEDGLGALAKMVLSVIDKSFCRILSYDESDKTLKVIAAEKATGKKGDFTWKQRLGEKTKLKEWKDLARSLGSGQSTILRRGDREAEAPLDQLSKLIELADVQDNPLPITQLLTIPLKVDDRIIGLMTIGGLQEHAEFSEADIEQAQAISNQASMVIERLELDKRVLNNLFETEREINASTNANKTLRLIAAQAYDIGRAYGRKVNVVDINVRDGNKLKVVAAYPKGQAEHIRSIIGDPLDLNEGVTVDHRLGIVGRTILTGVPLVESDVRSNPDYILIYPDTCSQLVVPIKQNDQIMGAISVESSEIGAFDRQDVLLFEGLALQAGSALLKDQQSREHKKVRTIALAGVAARLWRHGLKDRANQIIHRADQALSLSGGAEKAEILDGIARDAKYIRDFHFTPLSSEESVSEESLNLLLDEYFETFSYYMTRSGVGKITVEMSLTSTANRKVRINKVWFQEALGILVDNAHKAMMPVEKKKIVVTTEILADSFCRIRIMNTGHKVPDEIWNKMTNEQIRRPNQNSEKGAGLLIAEQIMAVYGGKVEKLRNEENSIEMGLMLPISG